MVEGEGFEPSKTESADLQSAPIDRSGTPPKHGRYNIIIKFSAKEIFEKSYFFILFAYFLNN